MYILVKVMEVYSMAQLSLLAMGSLEKKSFLQRPVNGRCLSKITDKLHFYITHEQSILRDHAISQKKGIIT